MPTSSEPRNKKRNPATLPGQRESLFHLFAKQYLGEFSAYIYIDQPDYHPIPLEKAKKLYYALRRLTALENKLDICPSLPLKALCLFIAL